MKTSQRAPIKLAAALGAPLASGESADWIETWIDHGDRERLWSFEPLPGKPGVPGLGEGAGGYRALVDLEDRVERWMAEANPTRAPVTVYLLEAMEAELAVSDTWLCNPIVGPGDPRAAIMEASGQ